jgi:hypothetical protein
MKAFAARSRDEDDLRTLAKIIGIDSLDAALALCSASSRLNRFHQGRWRCLKTCSRPNNR